MGAARVAAGSAVGGEPEAAWTGARAPSTRAIPGGIWSLEGLGRPFSTGVIVDAARGDPKMRTSHRPRP